jgi:micrococcal nuclease
MSVPIAAFAQTSIDGRESSDQSCNLETGEPGTVTEVVDGDTLILADGRVIRMAGVEAPKPILARPGSDIDGLATASRAALAALTSGARIEIRLGENPRDRHNRTLGHQQQYVNRFAFLIDAAE